MTTSHYSTQIRAGLSRIKNAVSMSVWSDPALSSCLEDMARGFNDCFRAFERRIQELEREVRRK